MIVFEYLYQMMGVFGPLMDEWARGRQRHIENEDDDVVINGQCLVLPKLENGIRLEPHNT